MPSLSLQGLEKWSRDGSRDRAQRFEVLPPACIHAGAVELGLDCGLPCILTPLL